MKDCGLGCDANALETSDPVKDVLMTADGVSWTWQGKRYGARSVDGKFGETFELPQSHVEARRGR
jgi:hypothetical protein